MWLKLKYSMWISLSHIENKIVLGVVVTSPVAQMIKNLPAMQETRVRSLGYTWYLSFFVWLTSLNMIISRPISVAANGIISCFFMTEKYSIIYMCVYIYIYIYTHSVTSFLSIHIKLTILIWVLQRVNMDKSIYIKADSVFFSESVFFFLCLYELLFL